MTPPYRPDPSAVPDIGACLRLLNENHPQARNWLLHHAETEYARRASRMLSRFPQLRRFEQTGDVLHNAVLRLHHALGTVRPVSPVHFQRLVVRHLHWELLDLVRHYYGPAGLGTNLDAGGGPHEGNEPLPARAALDEGPQMLAVWTEFHAAVERLPDELWRVFDLLWYQDVTQEQAAAELGADVKTVRRRWQDARLALRPFLPGPLPDDAPEGDRE
jgi:RNA polymerase sigma-70 factor (ECF subfamily)